MHYSDTERALEIDWDLGHGQAYLENHGIIQRQHHAQIQEICHTFAIGKRKSKDAIENENQTNHFNLFKIQIVVTGFMGQGQIRFLSLLENGDPGPKGSATKIGALDAHDDGKYTNTGRDPLEGRAAGVVHHKEGRPSEEAVSSCHCYC